MYTIIKNSAKTGALGEGSLLLPSPEPRRTRRGRSRSMMITWCTEMENTAYRCSQEARMGVGTITGLLSRFTATG